MIDLRPMRLPDEGAPQYFARLAQTNGFEGAEAMATSMDLNWFLIADGTCVDWMERSNIRLGTNAGCERGR